MHRGPTHCTPGAAYQVQKSAHPLISQQSANAGPRHISYWWSFHAPPAVVEAQLRDEGHPLGVSRAGGRKRGDEAGRGGRRGGLTDGVPRPPTFDRIVGGVQPVFVRACYPSLVSFPTSLPFSASYLLASSQPATAHMFQVLAQTGPMSSRCVRHVNMLDPNRALGPARRQTPPPPSQGALRTGHGSILLRMAFKECELRLCLQCHPCVCHGLHCHAVSAVQPPPVTS